MIEKLFVIRKITNLMSGKVFVVKYMDLRSLVLSVKINNTSIPYTLINSGESICVITKEILEKLQCLGL